MSAAITFIIPAYNAEATIRHTLDSLAAQTRADWQAIVVDDGSQDRTAEIVSEMAAADTRIGLVRTDRGRVCRARNAGLAAASTEWITFLDADDHLAPTFVAKMLAAAAGMDFVYCGYRRLCKSGKTLDDFLDPQLESQGFDFIARQCAIAIHCAVIRRRLILEVGGFDPGLDACEDWDLWQRLFRMDIRVRMVPEILALYVVGEATLSTNCAQMLRDGMTVLKRVCAADPRVANPKPAHANGLASDALAEQAPYFAAWCTGMAVGAGQDGATLLLQAEGLPSVTIHPPSLADTIVQGLIVGSKLPLDEVAAQYPRFKPALLDLVTAFAGKQHFAGFDRALRYGIEQCLQKRGSSLLPQPFDLTSKVRLDLKDLAPSISIPVAELTIIELMSGRRYVRTLNLGGFGLLSRSALAESAIDAIGVAKFIYFTGLWSRAGFWSTAASALFQAGMSTMRSALGRRSLRNNAPRTRLRLAMQTAAIRSVSPDRIETEPPALQHLASRLECIEAASGATTRRHALHRGKDGGSAWNGGPARRLEVDKQATFRLPVLVYHRIADEGPAALRQWRVTPENFETQMRYLRLNGFHTVTTKMVADARATQSPLTGRPILITFDDAYVDTATTAWPILQGNDLSAEVFVVTDRVGDAARWDQDFGPAARLMDWETIHRLHTEGMHFGSHLASHTPAPNLSSDALLDETLRSRLALTTHLRADVHSIAAPYGAIDERFVQICRLAGYRIGFSCAPGVADLRVPLFNLPRIEVHGEWTIAQFAAALDPGDR